MEDYAIIELFFARAEQAIAELQKKYGGICHKVSYQILHNEPDVEECVSDAYLGVWNTVPPSRPNPLCTYLCRIVRNLSLKRYHANTAVKRNSSYDVALEEMEHCLSGGKSVEEELEAKELARVNGMLNNEKFVSRAPQAKIDEEKAKLSKYTQMMDQVKERLGQLVK